MIIRRADNHVVPVAQKPSENILEAAGHRCCKRVSLANIFKSLNFEAKYLAEILQDPIHSHIFNCHGNAFSRLFAIDRNGLGLNHRLHHETAKGKYDPTDG